MSANKIPRHAIIVVCDASKGLLFVNQGDEDLPDLRITDTIEADANPITAEQGTDRPGRATSGSHRSAMDQTDWHQRAEADFAARVAEWSGGHHRDQPQAAVILVAPPQMLGDLRKQLPAEMAAKIIDEIAKDLVKLPTDQIERALVGG